MFNHQNRLGPAVVLIAALVVADTLFASVQTYSTCPGYPLVTCPPTWSQTPIPDNNASGVTITLDVPSEEENYITDVDAFVYVTHTWQGDVRIVLTSPAGTAVELINRPGSPGCGGSGFNADDLGNLPPSFILHPFRLDDSAVSPYNTPTVACPGINGVEGAWRPVSPLSGFNGQSKVGTWRLYVADLAGQDVGTLHVWGLTIRTEPVTPPVADVAIPDDYACACTNSAITGTASEPDGTFANYRLEWATDSAGPWNLINTSTTPVSNGVLGNLPGAMPEGNTYLRLIAKNILGLTTTFVKVVHPDRSFGAASIVEPQDNDVVGGLVCTDDISASDPCFASIDLAYSFEGGGFVSFFSSTNPAQPLPAWNTNGLANGNYTLRVTGTTVCGFSASDSVAVVVDNAPPVAQIQSPANCNSLSGVVPISGTVNDANLSGWTLQYTGGSAMGWVTIASGNTPIIGGLLANWNTAGLMNCSYTLRLLATDRATVDCGGGHSAESLVSVSIGAGGGSCDVNGDGSVAGTDIQALIDCLLGQ